MKAVVHIAIDAEDARIWEIRQELALTPEERFEGALELQERVYGTTVPDVRESGQVVILLMR